MTAEFLPVRVLRGHTSPASAYLVNTSARGLSQSTEIRYWIDMAGSGPKRGRRRFASQANNPTCPDRPWKRARYGRYELMTWIFLRPDGEIGHLGIGEEGTTPCLHAAIELLGIDQQMTPGEQAAYNLIYQVSRREPEPWAKWDASVRAIADRLPQTCKNPDILGSRIELATEQRFITSRSGHAIRLVLAQQLAAQR